MTNDVFSSFGALDELIQVIYQGLDKFILLSDISEDKWHIHLGLAEDGRWWHGSWNASDVEAIVVNTSSETLLEIFADKLAQCIVHGELHVETGDCYKLTIGPTSKKPMCVELEEMSAEDGAIYTTQVLLKIGLQAQSRQSRLNTAAFAAPIPPQVAPQSSPAPKIKARRSSPSVTTEPAHGTHTESKQRTDYSSSTAHSISRVKPEPSQESSKKKRSAPSPEPSSRKPTPPARPLKGASLANPNKKARKHQALQFASDDESC